MEISINIPNIPDTIMPTNPMMGIPFHVGGIPDNTTNDEPMIIAANTIAAANLLDITSSIWSKGLRPLISILTLPSLIFSIMRLKSPGITLMYSHVSTMNSRVLLSICLGSKLSRYNASAFSRICLRVLN